jgi:hypothetical protein
MKADEDQMVLVVARPGADLVKLSSYPSLMEGPCGQVGPMIATKVLQGKGSALVPRSHIRIATDTTDGVNAILDNFDLFDPDSQRPLLFDLLLREYRSSRGDRS